MRTAVLADVVPVTPRTRHLRLALTGGPFSFRAGQAVTVGLAGADVRAPYSIASSPWLGRDGTIELLVPADGPFGQTGLVADALAGATLDVDGPFGAFGVPADAGGLPLLLVAGGTGIAPLRSVVLDRLDRSSGPPARLVYSARTPDEFAFENELRWLAGDGHVTLYTTVTREPVSSSALTQTGRVDAAILSAALPSPDAVCLVCGPSGFVQTVTETLIELGVPQGRIVVER